MESFTVRLRRRALADVGAIRRWYRGIDPSLEDRFVIELNETLDRMRQIPLAYQVIYRNTRRISLRKFPYNVYYLVQDPKVVVLAVLHQKRDPALAMRAFE